MRYNSFWVYQTGNLWSC